MNNSYSKPLTESDPAPAHPNSIPSTARGNKETESSAQENTDTAQVQIEKR